MNELLKIILSLSLSGALLILVLFLCKPLVKDKLSKRWQYYIWLVVVARLLLPFAPETNLVGTLFQYFDNAAIQTELSPLPEQEPHALPEMDFSNQGKVGSGDGEQSEPDKLTTPSMFDIAKQNISVICLLVWLIVAIGLFIRKVTVYQSFVKYIKAGRIEISDMQLWERVGKLVEQTGIRGAVGLYTNSLISSPLSIGFFRPCIMLPTTEISESDFENTILHELTHHRRRDMFYKWLVQVTICFHWFNPFVYLMEREVNRACELSCDEAVIRKLDKNGQRAYGDTLLNAMGTGGNYKDSVASVTLNEGKELLKERLDAIMRFKKATRFTAVISTVLACAILFGAMATGAYATPGTSSSVVTQGTQTDNDETKKDGSALVNVYGNYGFTFDYKQNAVYYDGKRVGQFVDGGAYYTGGGYWCDFYYTDSSGVLFLHVVRGDRGEIQGIEIMSEDMLTRLFGQNKPLNMKPNSNNDSTKNAYQDFSKYGLTYDKQNNSVIYNGQPVKAFVDGGAKYKSAGYWFNITFFNDNISSNIYLTSIRDTNGTIVGIEEMTQEKVDYYYGVNGILDTSSTNDDTHTESTKISNDVQTVFSSFDLPELSDNTNKPGGYYFHNNDEKGISAVTRWNSATGTFSLCDISCNGLTADESVNIAYEITVSNGTFEFTQTTVEGTSILISEDVHDENIAYDYGVFELDLSKGNNDFSFTCKDADVSIRIIIVK